MVAINKLSIQGFALILFLMFFSCGHASEDLNFSFDVNKVGAIFKGSEAQKRRTLEFSLNQAKKIPATYLYIAANTAFHFNKLEDAIYLMYVADIRASHDFKKYPPSSKKTYQYLGFLRANIDDKLSSLVYKDIDRLNSISNRLSTFEIIDNDEYKPGWPFKSIEQIQLENGLTSDARILITSLKEKAKLLNVKEYQNHYDYIMEFYWSPPEYRKNEDNILKKNQSIAVLNELEKELNLVGFYEEVKDIN